MRQRGKVDRNQQYIVSALRQAGVSVKSTASVGDGFPDLVAGYRGQTYLLEVKSGDNALTPDEQAFFAEWRGLVRVVRSAEDALSAVGAA